MYRQVYTDIRLTDKFFDESNIERIKKDILNDKYGEFNEPVKEIINNLKSFSAILSHLGLSFKHIEKDEYHWCDFAAFITDLKIVEKLLIDYKDCFYEYSKIAFKETNSFNYYIFDFKENKLIEKHFPIATIYDMNNRSDIIICDNKFIEQNQNIISATEIYSLVESPWSDDSVSYLITKNNGLYKCSYTVHVYDGISVAVYGYANDKISAINNCDITINMLKDIASKENIKEVEE